MATRLLWFIRVQTFPTLWNNSRHFRIRHDFFNFERNVQGLWWNKDFVCFVVATRDFVVFLNKLRTKICKIYFLYLLSTHNDIGWCRIVRWHAGLAASLWLASWFRLEMHAFVAKKSKCWVKCLQWDLEFTTFWIAGFEICSVSMTSDRYPPGREWNNHQWF